MDAGDAAKVLAFCRRYPRAADTSANTSWTQKDEARTFRALVVACMPSVRARPESLERNRQIVRILKSLGYLSPTTAAIDVNVQRIIDDANDLIAAGWIDVEP